jgi:endosialidase-like protein
MGVGAAIAGAGILGAGASIYGGSQAASAQEKSAQDATNAQLQMFNVTQQNLEPYNTTGQSALAKENALAGNFNYTPTMAQTEQTPGYQFNLNQGLKATQNAAAARGLGTSGAALKGAASYATGLADSTYQNQFNNALQSYQTNLGGYQNLANLGENAAAGVGNAAQATGASIGSNLIGSGNAQAASYMNAANAVSGGAQSGVNGMLTNNLINTMANNNNAANSGEYGGQQILQTPGTWDTSQLSSDEQLKENIIPRGTENGWPIYEFNYIGQPQKYIGVMAQEVAKTMPEAVKEIDGYLAVDYNKLGVEFRKVA